jgi:integrase
MINTGYRPSEAAGLTAGRIRLDHEVPHLVIASDETRQIKNKTSRREIPLTGVSLEVFKAFPGGFPRYREKPASLSGTVNSYLRENRLMESGRHVMYSLRHSFEDRMLRGRIDERIRRELMGHSLGRQKYGQGGGLAFKAGELARIAIEGAFP